MDATAGRVLAWFDDIGPHLYRTLVEGADYANSVMMPGHWDSHVFAALVRYMMRIQLAESLDDFDHCKIELEVKNAAVHLHFFGLHSVRFRKASFGSTPPPGQSVTQQHAYQQLRMQLLGDTTDADGLPPLDLIADWKFDKDGNPVIHIGMPVNVWTFGAAPITAWRELLPRPEIFGGAIFQPAGDGGLPGTAIDVEAVEETS